MDTFRTLFGSLLTLVYHCFDRIVILGHLPLLTRPENIVHFFRDVHQASVITKEVLRQRTSDYNRWVDAFARKQRIPIEWAEKGVRKEDYVRSYLQRMERQNRFGVYFILKSMEVGPSFRSTVPRYPVEDPNYRIIARQRCRYTHYYFYIRDEVLGSLAMCVGSFLPFQITYYLNGHHYSERQLLHIRSHSARTTTLSWQSPILRPCRPPPIASVPISSASASITGLWSWGRNSPKRIARRLI